MNKIIGIENEPRKKQLFLLALAALCMGTAVTWFRIAATANCLNEHGSQVATLSTMIAMLVLPFAGLYFSWLTAKQTLRKTVYWTYASLIGFLVLIGLAGLLGVQRHVSPVMVFFIKFLGTFTFVPFWQLVAKTFPGKKSCRSCMVITAGFPVSQVIAGATCSSMMSTFGPISPVLAAIIAAALTVVLIQTVIVQIQQKSDCPVEKKGESTKTNPTLGSMKKCAFLIFALTTFITAASVLMTYIFHHVAATEFSTPEKLTSVLGNIEVIVGTLELFVMLFVSANLIQRWGVIPGLMILPVIISSLALVMISGSFGNLSILLIAAAAGHVIEAVTKPAFAKPTMKLVIDLLPTAPRMKMVAHVETICKPLASAVATGCVLLSAWAGFGLSAVIVVLLICGIGWWFAGVSATNLYREQQPGRSFKWQLPKFSLVEMGQVKNRFAQALTRVRQLAIPTRPNDLEGPIPTEMASVCGDSLVLTMPPKD